MIKNKIINEFCLSTGTPKYKIAETVGVTDGTFSKWLRNEIPEDVQKNMCLCTSQHALGEPYDLSITNSWRFKKSLVATARKVDAIHRRKSEYQAWKRLNYELDKDEERRVSGGWDTVR